MENTPMVEKLTFTEMELRIKELEEQISAYKHSEKDLKEYNERLENILFSLPTGILIIDTESQEIIEANPQALLMIGLPLELIAGTKYDQFIFQPEGQNLISDFSCDNPEGQLIGADGEKIQIHKAVIPVIFDATECVIFSFIDITEHKQTNYERIQKEKLQGVIEMARAVCHKMNQPLQAVMGLSELLTMDINEDDPLFSNLKNIQKQADSMGKITKKLMKVTRYETKDYLTEKIIDIDKATLSEPIDTRIINNQWTIE